MEDEYQVYLLHHRNDLLEQTAELINQEWPRSTAARIVSIGDGRDELPCSVLLTTKQRRLEERVVSHARIIPVAGQSRAALIESVIVPSELRGRGLGRRVMEEAERHAAKVGYKTMHLSTHDKQGFYSHLGYTNGPKVTPLRKCVANLDSQLTEALLEGIEGCIDSNHENSQAEGRESNPQCIINEIRVSGELQSSPPPPPAPPPPMVKQHTQRDSSVITWMVKSLDVH